jgi:ADP-glucose pyrophosphorylase
VILEEHSARLKDIIPQIKSVSRETGERPIIKFFEGYEGAVSAFEEFYANHKDSDKYGYFVFNRDLLEQTISEHDQQRFLKIRQKKDVEPITVYTKKSGDHKFTTPGKRVRIDQEKYPLLCEMVIVNDKVAISTLTEEKFTILIKSKDIATTFASLVRYINDDEIKKG